MQITFVDYIKKQYNVDVRHLDQPMLVSKLKPRKIDLLKGKKDEHRVAALVPELCFLTGLTDEQRANYKVMTDLANITRLTPPQRVENLNKFVKKLMGKAQFH